MEPDTTGDHGPFDLERELGLDLDVEEAAGGEEQDDDRRLLEEILPDDQAARRRAMTALLRTINSRTRS